MYRAGVEGEKGKKGKKGKRELGGAVALCLAWLGLVICLEKHPYLPESPSRDVCCFCRPKGMGLFSDDCIIVSAFGRMVVAETRTISLRMMIGGDTDVGVPGLSAAIMKSSRMGRPCGF